MSSEKYIGLDVHQATISVAVLDSTGKLVMESILETKAATIAGAGIAAAIRGEPKRQNPNPSKNETGLDASRHTQVSAEGAEKNFLLDILFHRVSEAIYRQLRRLVAAWITSG